MSVEEGIDGGVEIELDDLFRVTTGAADDIREAVLLNPGGISAVQHEGSLSPDELVGGDITGSQSSYERVIGSLENDLLRQIERGEFRGKVGELKELARLGRRIQRDFSDDELDLPIWLDGGFGTYLADLNLVKGSGETNSDMAISYARELISISSLNLIKSDVEVIFKTAGRMWSYAMHAIKERKSVVVQSSVDAGVSYWRQKVSNYLNSYRNPSLFLRLIDGVIGIFEDRKDGDEIVATSDPTAPNKPFDVEGKPQTDTPIFYQEPKDIPELDGNIDPSFID